MIVVPGTAPEYLSNEPHNPTLAQGVLMAVPDGVERSEIRSDDAADVNFLIKNLGDFVVIVGTGIRVTTIQDCDITTADGRVKFLSIARGRFPVFLTSAFGLLLEAVDAMKSGEVMTVFV